MAIIFDTNILVHLVRDNSLDSQRIRQIVNPTVELEYISIVTVGELYSFALQNGWESAKINKMNKELDSVTQFGISEESVLRRYAEIDAFSKRKIPSNLLQGSARKMGKNDLWIAAIASILELPLATTDKDFDHLHNIYLEVQYHNPDNL